MSDTNIDVIIDAGTTIEVTLEKTGPAGAASAGDGSLVGLADVVVTNPADNDLITYDGGTDKYINQTAAQAGVATASAVSTHIAKTTTVHGIADTSALATTANITTHGAVTTSIHGIADTSVLETTAGSQAKADASAAAATTAHNILEAAHTHLREREGGFCFTGTLATSDDALEVRMNKARTLVTPYFRGGVGPISGTIPTGTAIIFEVYKNGTSIYASTPANRPTIAASTGTFYVGVPDVITFAAGDWISIRPVQIGSTSAGKNASITPVFNI